MYIPTQKTSVEDKLPLIGLGIAIVIILLAIGVSVFTGNSTQRRVVALIPAAHLTIQSTGGGTIPVWGPFKTPLKHHAWCRRPITKVKRGIHGVYRQRFAHCEMAMGPVSVYPYRSPVPTATASRPPVSPPQAVPTRVPPTSVPRPTVAPTQIVVYYYPTSVPTPVAQGTTSNDACQQGSAFECAQMIVGLINAERQSQGIAPLQYSSLLANGNGTCIGAQGHANHMANDLQTIAHDQFPADVCAGSAMGENVGVSAYGSLYNDAMQIHTGMMTGPNEVYTPGCQGNHHCDWMDPNHTYVGIAFAHGTFQGLPANYESEEYSNAG